MKRLLLILALVTGLVPVARAANPSFDSFDTNYFKVTLTTTQRPLIQLQPTQVGPAGTNVYYFYTTVITNVFATYLVVSNISAGNIMGTDGFYSRFIGDGSSLSNAPAYVTNNNQSVFIGDGGSTFYNSLQVPFLSDGGVQVIGGYLTNGFSNGTNTQVIQLGPFTPGRYLIANGTNTATDGSFYLSGTTNVGFDGVLLWGPGATNALYRSGGNLVYTNGTSNPGFQVISGIGESSYFLAGSSAALVRGINGVTLSDESGNTVRLFAKYFAPSVTDEKLGGDYGTSLHPWAQVNSLGETIWGYKGAASTNYSRLAVSHGGTNGYVEFRSQGLGIAGVGRPFSFTNDTANAALSVWSTNGNALTMLTDAGNVPTLLSSTATLYLKQTGGAAFLYLNNGAFGPNNDNVIDNGTRSSSWNDGAYKGTVYIAGMDNGSTDYSRLAISHAGTNNSIVFDSQASGIAGNPRPVYVSANGTNFFRFTYDNGSSILPDFRVYSADGTHYVGLNITGGAAAHLTADSTIFVDQQLVTKNVTVANDNTWDIGSNASNGAYKDFYQKGVHYVQGFNNGSGDVSRLAISHTGTNGFASINSVGTGIAGDARPIAFRFGGTNNVILTPNGPMILPSLTRAQRDAVSPTNGMVFYQSDSTAGLRAYIGGAWYTVNVTADP